MSYIISIYFSLVLLQQHFLKILDVREMKSVGRRNMVGGRGWKLRGRTIILIAQQLICHFGKWGNNIMCRITFLYVNSWSFIYYYILYIFNILKYIIIIWTFCNCSAISHLVGGTTPGFPCYLFIFIVILCLISPVTHITSPFAATP